MLKFCTIIHTPRKVVGQLKIQTINNKEQFRVLTYKQLTTMRKLILKNIKGLVVPKSPNVIDPNVHCLLTRSCLEVYKY